MLWLLGDHRDPRVLAVQNHLLGAVSRGGIEPINLLPEDYARIVTLNVRDADLPGASGANPSTAFRSADTPGVPSNVTPGALGGWSGPWRERPPIQG